MKQSRVDLGAVPEQEFFQQQATNLFNQARDRRFKEYGALLREIQEVVDYQPGIFL